MKHFNAWIEPVDPETLLQLVDELEYDPLSRSASACTEGRGRVLDI
jgi:hypothetical protein